MRKLIWVMVPVCVVAWTLVATLVAEDAPPTKPGGDTSARATAEAGFAAIRKAAADHDEASLAARLPTSLVKGWRDESAADGKAWRQSFAEEIAAGEVVSVTQSGDTAIARWKTARPAGVWETRLRFEGDQWSLSSPWPYCVSGAELSRANGRAPAHVKLTMRKTNKAYGSSAYSFAHVTQDPEQCKNRMDIVYCRCGGLHGLGGSQFAALAAKSLDAVEGLQTAGNWSDRIVPASGALYAMQCDKPGRRDFQLAFKVTAKSDAAVELDWRLIATGRNAPASIHRAQPLESRDGADGTSGICGESGK